MFMVFFYPKDIQFFLLQKLQFWSKILEMTGIAGDGVDGEGWVMSFALL